MKGIIGVALAVGLLLVPAGFAQNAGTLKFDSDILTAGIQTPGNYSLAAGGNVVLYLVLEGVTDMIGVSTDIKFDPAVLQLVGQGRGVAEDQGDVNFDGKINVFDITKLIQERQSRDAGNPGIAYYDLTQDNALNVFDIVRSIQSRQQADGGVNFWTNTRAGASVLSDLTTESVEIFDSNVQNGLLDDLVAVLLIRPVGGVRVDTNRGFDSDPQRTDPATQNATIARLEFQVITQTPQATVIDILTADEAAKIATLGPNANAAVVLHEGKTVDQLANPAGVDLTLTIVP
ncbi:MAG: hypothetical protein HS131_10655 [Ignavibacteriales bacterium]|nr:hypothetical protein [Ignavibacteriales bacterium]